MLDKVTINEKGQYHGPFEDYWFKVTINEKGQYHGPYEDYWFNGNLWEKAHYVNGEAFGYSELNNQKGTEKIIYYFCR